MALVGGGGIGTLAVLLFAIIFAGAFTSQANPAAGSWFASWGTVVTIILVIAIFGGVGGWLKFRT